MYFSDVDFFTETQKLHIKDFSVLCDILTENNG